MQAADDNPGPRRAATSVLISVNDLEAVAIKQLAAAAGATVVDLALDWGGQPASAGAPFDINALEDSIILVETPDIALEEALRAAGKIVRVVDHHIYLDREGQLLDRSASRSSLEQVARLLGFESPLTRAIVTVGAATFGAAAIAANDSGYWPGVMRHYLETGEPDRLNEGCIVFTDPAAPDIDLAALAGKAARYAKQALNAVVQLRDAEIRLRAEVQGKPARPIREWFNLLDEAQLRLAVLPTRSGGGDPGRTLRLLAVGEACRGAPIGDWLYHRIVQERIDAITDPDHQLHESLVSAKDGRLLLNLAAMAAPVDMLIVQLGRSASGPAQTGCPPEDLAACPVQDLFFSGGPGARDLVMDMMRMAGPGEAFDGLSLYAGAGSDAVFLGAGGGPDQAHALSRLADTLLEALLTGARPLTQWRTHIIQGLQPGSEQASGLKRVQAVKPAKAAAGKPGLPVARPMTFEPNERAYFLDHLRNRLLGPPAPAEPHCMDGTATAPDINWMELDWRSFEIMSPGDAGAAGGETPPASGRPGFLEVEWGAIAEGADGDGIEIHRRLRAKISAIRVHFAFNQVVFIECEVEGAPWPNYSDGAPLWRQILTHQTPVGEPVTLADLLDFNELARQCYSAWEHGGGERRRVRLLDADGQPIAGAQTIIQSAPGREEPEHPHGWFAALARDALAPWRLDPSHLRFIHDERARIVSSALPAGSAPRGPYGEARHTVMLARFAGVDAFDEAFLYDPDFSRRELALQSYDRFAATGSYFATSGHALTLLGYGWFPREHIKKHMSRQYMRMFLIAMHYSAVLLGLSREIGAAATRRLDCDGHWRQRLGIERTLRRLDDDVHDARLRMTAFANGVWYDQVSPQLQGQELFDAIVSRMPIRAHYDELTREIERFDTLAQHDSQIRDANRFKTVSRLGVFLGAAVTAGGMGLAVVQVGDVPIGLWGLPASLTVLGLSAAAGLVAALALTMMQDDTDPVCAARKLVLEPLAALLSIWVRAWARYVRGAWRHIKARWTAWEP